jgi:hypothetical protein
LNQALDRLLGDAAQRNPGVSWNEWNDLFPDQPASSWPRKPVIVSLPWRTDRKGIYWSSRLTPRRNIQISLMALPGIGYFLSILYEATKDERYLLSALAAGHSLQSVVSKAESSRHLIFTTMPVVGISST